MAAVRFHLLGLALVLAAAGCSKRYKEPYALAGGKTIAPHTLQEGYEAFMLYCYGCHGEKGDGKGPASFGMRPPPRNFSQGLFKFAGVSAGQLPTDEALLRTIRRGLHGTPMLPWDITEHEREAMVAYIKTLSKRWQEEEPGEPLVVSEDPWGGKTKEAVEKGKEVYHVSAVGHAGCSGCHAAYASRQEISDMAQKITGQPVTDFAEEMYRTSLRETEYPLIQDEKGETVKAYQQLPPDFLFHKLKTVFDVGTTVDGKPYTAQDQRVDLYRAIAAGIGGAAMPQWKGALPEENMWALVYYVQSLVQLRGTNQAYALRTTLESQPKPTPAAPPAEQPPAPTDGAPAKGGGSR
jgi:mono/diheme cytochrome c family protein